MAILEFTEPALASRATAPLVNSEGKPIDLPCFFYGSLMEPRVLKTVTRSKDDADLFFARAQISGHIRHPYIGQPYPGMIATPNNQSTIVEGLLAFGHSRLEMERLDQFEGDEYPRTIRKVTLLIDPGMIPERFRVATTTKISKQDLLKVQGLEMEAYVYVYTGPIENLDQSREWDYEGFRKHHVVPWMTQSTDFDDMIGRTTP